MISDKYFDKWGNLAEVYLIVVYKLVQPIQFSALTDNFLTELTQSYYVGHPRQLSITKTQQNNTTKTQRTTRTFSINILPMLT